jgi:solute carrier family 25 carnitine/acylcarnitine transporter 20/29
MIAGIAYGMTAALVGHPIDSVKTKMQAQDSYRTGNAFRTMVNVVRNEGVLGLWRGLLPPLIGSSMYRSTQFGVYAACYKLLDRNPAMKNEIPLSAGMQWRVLVSGVVASTARAIIETPLEFIKVRRQTGQSWRVAGTAGDALHHPLREVRHCYTGFGVSWLRTTGLMTQFFLMVDHLERHHHDLMTMPGIGPFIKGGVCATLAWITVWPFEVLKSQIQAGTPGVPESAGWVERARWVVQNRGGFMGLYRGIGPGIARSLIANGSSMVVFDFVKKHTSW